MLKRVHVEGFKNEGMTLVASSGVRGKAHVPYYGSFSVDLPFRALYITSKHTRVCNGYDTNLSQQLLVVVTRLLYPVYEYCNSIDGVDQSRISRELPIHSKII